MCQGNEESILQCPQSTDTEDCESGAGAAVVCQGKGFQYTMQLLSLYYARIHKSIDIFSICLYTALDTTDEELCVDGDVKLVDGSNPLEGRVEICFNHAWGTICNNSFSISDATVVCRQLGYHFNGSQVLPTSNFLQASGPIFLDELACTGDEERVEDCVGPAPGLHTCTHDQDTAIRCIGK